MTNILLKIWKFVLCIIIAAIIPGLIWWISDILISIFAYFQKEINIFLNLSLFVKILTIVVGGIIIYWWHGKRKK